MNIPTSQDLETWEKGLPISDESLDKIEAFYREMLKGAEAIGPNFTVVTEWLRNRHDFMELLQRRRKDRL